MAELQEQSDQHSTGLKKCFLAFVNRKQINFDLVVLNVMLRNELQINLDALDEDLAAIMPLMLATYMKNWPGWQRSKEYFSGKLNVKEWYDKFRQYMILRLTFLVKNGYKSVLEEIEEEERILANRLKAKKKCVEHGTQTDPLAPNSMAPFSINIDCAPSLLGSLIFTDSGDDVILKHHSNTTWNEIDFKQLLHWPTLQVEFFSPELAFKRKNCGDHQRFITFVNTPIVYDKPDYIEQVEIIDKSNGRHCFTLQLLKCYTKEYVNILKSIKSVNEQEVRKIEMIIEEFLKDIEEIDMNGTMASNTSVLFNIGKCSFFRNKRMSKTSYFVSGACTDVSYCETLIPKMETSLYYFKGIQDISTVDISFSYLNIIKRMIKNNEAEISTAIPLIVYKCNFCNESFKTDSNVMKHFEEFHRVESNFLCILCRNSLAVSSLASNRWQHKCMK